MARILGEPPLIYCTGTLCMLKENSRYRQTVTRADLECHMCYAYDVAGQKPKEFAPTYFEPTNRPRVM